MPNPDLLNNELEPPEKNGQFFEFWGHTHLQDLGQNESAVAYADHKLFVCAAADGSPKYVENLSRDGVYEFKFTKTTTFGEAPTSAIKYAQYRSPLYGTANVRPDMTSVRKGWPVFCSAASPTATDNQEQEPSTTIHLVGGCDGIAFATALGAGESVDVYMRRIK